MPFLALPKVVRWILGLLVASYLIELIGRQSDWFSWPVLMALVPQEVWSGQIWRLWSYPLLAGGILSLLFSGLLIAWIGSRVAGVWSTREFLSYCGLCVGLAGVAFCLIAPSGPFGVGGPPALIVALAIAWARLFGHERLRLADTFELSCRTLAAIICAWMLLAAVVAGDWRQGILLAVSGAAGWLYLSLRWKLIRAQPARGIVSNRFDRLEL